MGKFEKNLPNGSRRNSGKMVLLVLTAILILAGSAVGIFGRYVTTRIMEAEMHAAGFYVSSDYLALNGTEGLTEKRVPVSGWNEGIYLELYNYEIVDGTEKITDTDMTFTCTASDGWTVTTDKQTLSGGQKNTAKLSLTTPAGAKKGDEVKLTVVTGPFEVKLEVIFTLTDAIVPDYVITDMGAYEMVTIHSNNYSGAVTVNWDTSKRVPDRTNALMGNFQNGSGTIQVEKFQTYELMFFEEASEGYTSKSGEGTTVPVN